MIRREMKPADWIAVVGSLNVDVALRVAAIPGEGETVLAEGAGLFGGGKGANQALQAARLGASVRMIGRVGRDPLAALALEQLAAAGVDVESVAVDEEASTGLAAILVERGGANRIVVASGANGRLSPADVERHADVIARSRLLLCQLEVPLETVEHAVALARRAGVTVVLNPAPARALPGGLLAAVDVLVPNRAEAEQLSGLAVRDASSALAAAEALLDRGAKAVAVTLGEAGAAVASGRLRELVPAFAVERIVDTTAAGDAFCGALAAALAAGRDLVDAVRAGAAAGAVAVTRAGAQPSLGDRAEIEALLSRAP